MDAGIPLRYKPWPDIIQRSMPDQPNVTEFAFEHYSTATSTYGALSHGLLIQLCGTPPRTV